MKRFAGLLAAMAVLGVLVLLGYNVSWTGFGPSTGPGGQLEPGKTLWDWLDLLLVPLLLAVAAWLLDSSRKASEARIELDRQRQATLTEYFGCMTALLLEGKLAADTPDPKARSIARTRTLAVLRAVDGSRKAQILQFLYESGLIGASPIVNLNGADFTGARLEEAVLRDAELRGVDFREASFRRAHLAGADLRGSDFTNADFTGAQFDGAQLAQAILTDATVEPAALALAATRAPADLITQTGAKDG